jgi:hypothetical protein
MLIVSSSGISKAGAIPLIEDLVEFIARTAKFLPDKAWFKLHDAVLRELDRIHRAKDATLKNRVNSVHGEPFRFVVNSL